MALRFLEGFELYGGYSGLAPQFSKKWGVVYQYYSINVGQTGRTAGTYAGSLSADWYAQGDLIITPAFTPYDEWVIGFAYKRQTTSINGYVLRVQSGSNAATDIQLEFKQNGTSFTVTRNADYLGGVLLNTWTVSNDTNWHHIQLKFKISPTNGYVRLIYDGVDKGSTATNINTQRSAPAVADRFMFMAPWGAGTTGYNSVACYYDDIYICDTTGTSNNDFLGNCIIEGIKPSTAGGFSQFESVGGPNYDVVNDSQLSESDYVRTKYSGVKDTYNFQNLSKVFSNIKGIQINLEASQSGVGNSTLGIIAKSSSNIADINEFSISGITSDNFFKPLDLNPINNQSWNVSDINNIEFGIKVPTKASPPVWITNATLLDSYVNYYYETSIVATNEATYSITSGALPDGITLDSLTGKISGTNTTVLSNTTYNFTIQATNAYGSVSKSFSITVYITKLSQIYAWGGGGGGGKPGGWTYGAVGGAGGAANAYIPLNTGTYYITVGGGGVASGTTSAEGGGGIASRDNEDNRYGGGGGGYSGVFSGTPSSQVNALIIAGGGGGGGSSRAGAGNVGGAGGGSIGENGSSPYDGKISYRGLGGSQISAGADAATSTSERIGYQAALLGGSARINCYGGAGGGGYYGGSAGGYSEPNTMGGGGGGSGYIKSTYVGTLTEGVGTIPGDSTNSLRGTAGNAGIASGNGSAGKVVIKYLLPQIATGGTVTDDGTYVYHTFTSSGTLVVS